MADDVWKWCDARQTFGRTVTVKIKYGDFQQITRSRSQPAVIVTQEHLQRSAVDLVRTVLPAAKGIRLVGVTVSNFAEVAAPAPAAGDTELPIFAETKAA